MFTKKVDIVRRALLQELANERRQKRKKLKLCDAEKCKNTSHNSDLSFFKFPTHQPEKMKKWLSNITLKKGAKVDKRICCNHFEERAFTNTFRTRLHYEAIPTIQDPNDLVNEEPKPYPCLLGLSTLKKSNAVQNITNCPPVFETEKDAVIATRKDEFPLSSWNSPKSTDVEPNSVSIFQNESCAGNIEHHHSKANKATMTSPFLEQSSPAYTTLKAQMRAKSSTVCRLKKRIEKIDNKVPTPNQLIKYASHYMKGKTLSLFAAQIQNGAGKEKSGFRWNQDNLELANNIYQMNRSVYRYLISNNILHLPCRQTLRRFRTSKQKVCDHVDSMTMVEPSENEKLDETNGICTIRQVAYETSEITNEIEVKSNKTLSIIEPYVIRLKPCEIKEEFIEIIEEPMDFFNC